MKMNVRTALKIVKRYKAAVEAAGGNPILDFKWPGPGPCYSTAQTRQAHLMLKLPFEAPAMKGETTPVPPPAPKKAQAAPKKAAPPKEVKVDVGAMKVKVEAGKDGVLGTKDDKVTIKPKKVAKPKAAPKAKAPAKPKAKPAAKKPVAKKLSKATLKSMTVADLKGLAKAAKVKGYSSKDKKALVAALS